MKINSNIIKLEKESFEQLEEVIKKIASENKIENVEGVEVRLSKDNGVVKFKSAADSIPKEQMLKLLQQNFPKGKFIDGEDWGGEDYKHTIIASGEEGSDEEGLTLFDNYAEDYEEKYYIMGVNKKIYELLDSYGWWSEWYDGGTVVLYPN